MSKRFFNFRVLITSSACAIVMGAIAAIFLTMLDIATDFRKTFPYSIFSLPFVSLLTAFVYFKYGKNTQGGNNLIIKSVNRYKPVPKRLAFLTFIFTILTHFAGGSVGREGTATQIGGTITSNVADKFGFKGTERQVLVMSGISAAFGSVFGTPFGGAFFGMEVCCIGGLSVEAFLPCLVSGYSAYAVTMLFEIEHESHVIKNIPEFNWELILMVIIASICFGIIGKMFAITVKYIKKLYAKLFKNYLLRAFVGACVVVAIIYFGKLEDYEGLSTWMQDHAFRGTGDWYEMPLKFMLTTLTLGAGMQGGEVTPLFNMGACFGSSFGLFCGMEPSFFAALGLICVFGAAANTPIATVTLGVELFGTKALPYFVISAIISFLVSGNSSIYSAQKIKVSKGLFKGQYVGKTIADTPDFIEKLTKLPARYKRLKNIKKIQNEINNK